MSFRIDATDWANEQFGDCQLGDQRRTKRLIKVAEQVAGNPSASFPDQMKSWGDLKSAYRLFACEDVTFEAIARPHWQQTRSVGPGRYLVLDDTTEIDFGYKREIEGLSKGTYPAVTVGWRDPNNPMEGRILGIYWDESDSLGVDDAGNVMVQPTSIEISDAQLDWPNLDIKANLDIAP